MEFLPFLGPIFVGIGLGFQAILFFHARKLRDEARLDYQSTQMLHSEMQILSRQMKIIDRMNTSKKSGYKISMFTAAGDVLLLNEDGAPRWKGGKVCIDCSYKFEETMDIDILQIDISDDHGVVATSVPMGATKYKWRAGDTMHTYLSINIGNVFVEVE